MDDREKAPVKILRLMWVLFLPCATAFAEDATIVPGGDWRDNNGNLVEAHGGSITKVGNTYYLYGNDQTYYLKGGPYSNTFYGTNLTGFAHPEGSKLGVATCDTIGGNYTFIRAYNPLGLDSRDMSAFVDDDGTGHVITATNNNTKATIFRLTSDYLDVESMVNNTDLNGEGTALFKKDGLYYVVLSGYTGWTHNDNWYQTATNLAGPWSAPVTLADAGTNTYESQVTFVVAVPGTRDTTYVYMGDRWLNGTSDSRHVWLPLKFNGTAMHMDWYDSWNINTATGTWSISDVSVTPTSDMVISEPGDAATYTLVLNRAPTQDVTITVTPDAQLLVDKPTLTFTAGNYNIPQTVTVTAADGAGAYTGLITHTAASGDVYYNDNGAFLPVVTVTIAGNDSPAVAAAGNDLSTPGFGRKCTATAAAPPCRHGRSCSWRGSADG